MTYGTKTNMRTAINRINEQQQRELDRVKKIETRLIWGINLMLLGFLIAGHLMQRSF
jgi:hypothetical protein